MIQKINNSFRPEKPKEWLSNSREWLSTVDIEKVLSQYEENIQITLILDRYL